MVSDIFGWKLTRTQRSFVEWVPDQTGHCLNHVKCHFSILLLINTPTIKRLLQIANEVHWAQCESVSTSTSFLELITANLLGHMKLPGSSGMGPGDSWPARADVPWYTRACPAHSRVSALFFLSLPGSLRNAGGLLSPHKTRPLYSIFCSPPQTASGWLQTLSHPALQYQSCS